MRHTRQDRARLVALVLAVVDALFIVVSVLSRTSEPEALVVAAVNLVLVGAVLLLLRRPSSRPRGTDRSRQVF